MEEHQEIIEAAEEALAEAVDSAADGQIAKANEEVKRWQELLERVQTLESMLDRLRREDSREDAKTAPAEIPPVEIPIPEESVVAKEQKPSLLDWLRQLW